MANFTLADLEKIIASRALESAEKSYTRKLLDAGIEKSAKKLGEEATEAVIAATIGTKEQVVAESADLLYHLLVVMKARGVDLREVYEELAKRTAQSGIEEKASRK
jgi:phosphoribosyl-ATP pyrophosphohydrolase